MTSLEKTEQQSVPRSEMAGWVSALFEAIDDAIFIHDQIGRILEINPAACRRLGYSREELLRMNTHDIDLPGFAAGFQERLKNQLATGTLRCEGRHRTKDGRIIPVDINSSVIRFQGQPAILAVMRDITETKKAEARLQTQYAVARVLAEAPNLEECARKILEVMCESLTCDAGSLFVVNHERNLLECLGTWHQPGLRSPAFDNMTRRMTFAPGVGLPGRVWQSGQPAVVTDLAKDLNCPRRDTALREGFKGGFAFPIQSSGETTGAIEFFLSRMEKPDSDMLSMMAALGSQIGQVLERQRVEKALRDSEALYHSLVESLPQNIFRKDKHGRLSFANSRYCATLKRPLTELLGKTDHDLFPPALAAKYVRDDQSVLETGMALETIEEHMLPGGEKIYVQVVKTPVRDAQGAIIGIQGIFWDVTEKKRAEEALADSERRYRVLAEATIDGIIVADQNGTIVLFNPAAERLFGYKSSEIQGQPLTTIVPPQYREAHMRGFRRYLDTRQARVIGQTVELQGLRKDGSQFPLELALSPIVLGPPGPDGKEPIHFLGALRDLTERNRMRAILVQNEKLASIGLLSAGVAHEINNPLAFVANNLTVLERDGSGLLQLADHLMAHRDELARIDANAAARATALADEIDLDYLRDNLRRLLKRTREGVDRVSRIVQSLRGLARTDVPKRHDTYLPDLVETGVEILRGRMRQSGIEVIQDHDPNPRVSCVSSQISQVLLNLLVNATQAIESAKREHGHVTVRTRRLKKEILIEVSDDGCGIEPDRLPKIFDPFYTTKDVGEGTGLGLSISHNIVMGHGGRFEVESTPGAGSCFRVYLPLHDSPGGDT
jgi:two-component system NtrC family sensor kinase